ncbi:sulfotransferase [Caballeronia sp. ATUFL_M2_KS44]|uniref:sulfotransferase family protein n=1 Tax=Caballeronia sp. ATUFL_M2_KS44 TaxID=2921767 RepID=UPI0020286166|nr:sulfotransferase [Caballeronia sp. ATUFL_M2_KS44]
MFILFGSPRSGTTLFKESLNLHPQVLIPFQTTFISPVAHLMGSIRDWSKARPLVEQLIVSTDDYASTLEPHISRADVHDALDHAEPTVAGVLKAIYGKIAANTGKAIAGDKTPDDLLSIRKLEEVGVLASDIKFLHIVRDVRGVLSSLRNVSWAPAGIEEYFPRLWNYTNLHLFRAMQGQPNYLMVRYEDLVANPRDTLQKSSALLGLPFDEAMLDHAARAPVLRHDQSHLNLSQPFQSERATSWTRSLDADVQKHCHDTAGEALRVFGYA